MPERKCLFDFGDEFLESFEVLGEIGRGSFGAVLRARQLSLNREVAIKYLLPNAASVQEMRRRFKREAKVLCMLVHPNIIDIYSFGFDGKAVYLVQELLQGQTVEDWYEDLVPPSIDELMVLGADLASALATAHKTGVVHRDVKPANIFVCENQKAKLLDFGLAKGRAFDTVLTATGCLTGTPLYLAPEQLFEKEPRGENDVYALGIVLYEGICGHAPFHADSLEELYRDKIGKSPQALAEVAPTAPPALCQLIDSMVRLEPDDRPNAIKVEKQLRSLIAGDKSVAQVHITAPTPPKEKEVKVEQKKKSLVPLVLPLVLLLLLALMAIVLFSGDSKPFELEIAVSKRAPTSLLLSAECSLAADVKVSVKDSKSGQSMGTFDLPGRGRQLQKAIVGLPANREYSLVAQALVAGRPPLIKELVCRTKAAVPQMIAQWKPLEVDEGPVFAGDYCCILTKEQGYWSFLLSTGEIIWRMSELSPIESLVANKQFVFVCERSGLIQAREWEDGKLRWEHRFSGRTSESVCTEDVLIIKNPNRGLTCLDVKSGKERWTMPRFVKGGWNIIGGKLYVYVIPGSLTIIDVNSGRRTFLPFLKSDRLTAEPYRVGNILCFPAEGRLLFVQEEKVLNEFNIGGKWAKTIADDKRIYAFNSKEDLLYAIDVKQAKYLWKAKAEIDLVGMYVAAGYLYMTDKNTLRCYRADSGLLLWNSKKRAARRFPMLPIKNGAVWCDRSGKLWKMIDR